MPGGTRNEAARVTDGMCHDRVEHSQYCQGVFKTRMQVNGVKGHITDLIDTVVCFVFIYMVMSSGPVSQKGLGYSSHHRLIVWTWCSVPKKLCCQQADCYGLRCVSSGHGSLNSAIGAPPRIRGSLLSSICFNVFKSTIMLALACTSRHSLAWHSSDVHV